IQLPAGAGGDELRGTRSGWMGFRGRHDETGGWSTVVMVDDAANPRHPPQWFARSEMFACLCPAPFFSEELRVEDGRTLSFRYAVVIADGDHGEEGTALLAEQGRTALTAPPLSPSATPSFTTPATRPATTSPPAAPTGQAPPGRGTS